MQISKREHLQLLARQPWAVSQLPDKSFNLSIEGLPRWEVLYGLWCLTYAMNPWGDVEKNTVTPDELKKSIYNDRLQVAFLRGRPIHVYESAEGWINIKQYMLHAPTRPMDTLMNVRTYLKDLHLQLIGRKFIREMDEIGATLK